MPILIVSANPLFREIITSTVGQFQVEVIELNPEEALTKVCALRPDVIILDETTISAHFETLFAQARALQKTRIIVLNPTQNEIILLDTRRATLRKVDDLIEAIASDGYEIRSEIKE